MVFLHELRRGGADRSYGIHVAELAGIPRAVIRRASELLADLESKRPENRPNRATVERATRSGNGNGSRRAIGNGQLSLFELAPSPLIEMLRRMNVNELSPIEALTKLYELQRLAKQ